MSSRKQQLKDQQLKDEITRLEEEEKFLKSDIDKLENGMDPNEACAQIYENISSAEDPFNSLHNEWVKPEPGACCIIM